MSCCELRPRGTGWPAIYLRVLLHQRLFAPGKVADAPAVCALGGPHKRVPDLPRIFAQPWIDFGVFDQPRRGFQAIVVMREPDGLAFHKSVIAGWKPYTVAGWIPAPTKASRLRLA